MGYRPAGAAGEGGRGAPKKGGAGGAKPAGARARGARGRAAAGGAGGSMGPNGERLQKGGVRFYGRGVGGRGRAPGSVEGGRGKGPEGRMAGRGPGAGEHLMNESFFFLFTLFYFFPQKFDQILNFCINEVSKFFWSSNPKGFIVINITHNLYNLFNF